MATKLTKPVHREMLAIGLERGKHRSRGVIVSLLPGDDIRFRIKGTRQVYDVSLAHTFRLAQAFTIEHNYRLSLKTYAERKKLGYRVRKPKRPMIPFVVHLNAVKRDQ